MEDVVGEPTHGGRSQTESDEVEDKQIHGRCLAAHIGGHHLLDRRGGGRLDADRLTRCVEDYTNKYKGEQLQVALFGGEYQDGVLTAYCHFAVIYGQNPVGLPVPEALKAANLGDNLEKANRILQEIAWEAVTAEPMSGMKATETR